MAVAAITDTDVRIPPFETALFTLSDCLAEAHCALEWGDMRRAYILHRLAERYALRTGYVELLQLTWAYAEMASAVAPAPSPFSSRAPRI